MAPECDEQLRVQLPAHAQNITSLRRAVLDFAANCGASARRREDIALGISEALTNAVLHAYVGHMRPGEVEVQAWVRGCWLEVVVRDDGRGMLPDPAGTGLGLGLSLMAQMTHRLVIEDAMPGVRVRMTFAIA